MNTTGRYVFGYIWIFSDRGSFSFLRGSIISGEELAKSDVGERESRREKKAGDSRDVGKKRAKCIVAAAPQLQFFHVAAKH